MMSVDLEKRHPLAQAPRLGSDHAKSFAVGMQSTLLGHPHHLGRFGVAGSALERRRERADPLEGLRAVQEEDLQGRIGGGRRLEVGPPVVPGQQVVDLVGSGAAAGASGRSPTTAAPSASLNSAALVPNV